MTISLSFQTNLECYKMHYFSLYVIYCFLILFTCLKNDNISKPLNISFETCVMVYKPG